MFDNLVIQASPILVDQLEAATLLGISERTFWDLRKRKLIHPVRINTAIRFRVCDLHALAETLLDVPSETMKSN